MSLNDVIAGSLRALRTDPADRSAFVRLVVDLWRWGGLSESRILQRPVHVVFRLSGGITRKELARGQTHPWGFRVHNGRGRKRWHAGSWWTVAFGGPWGFAGLWIMAVPDSGAEVFFNRNWCKSFETAGELADYLQERATEWKIGHPRVLPLDGFEWEVQSHPEPAPPTPCHVVLGPSLVPCSLGEGHEGAHAWEL